MGLAIMKRCCTLLLLISLAVTCCESQPTFFSSSYVTTVSELTAVGSTIINVTATAGSPGNSLTYNIFNHPSTILDIDSSTGSVILIGSLDYEQEATFTFNVEAIEDMGVVMTPVTVNIVNANDEVPLCSATIYTLTIPESSAVGSHILSLLCSDSDGDSLEYYLEGDSENIFQLDTLTTSLSLAAPVDSEVASTHNVLVNVFDGEHSVQLKVYVYVEPSNEHIPRFNQTVYDCSVDESAAIGSIFCWVFAEDEDSGLDGQLSYAITSGNEANKFGIDSTTGEIVLTGYIDYESLQGYLIFVRVTDNGESPFGNSVQVRITVLDSNDNAPIVNPLITAVIAENSALGSVVKVLMCSDADSGINRDVELIIDSQTNAAGDNVAVFSIEPSTNELITDSNIDYEESSFYTIALTCRDNGSPSLSTSSTIIVGVSPVNEFAPVLTQDTYSATVAENLTVGTSVLEVTAMDSDTGPDGNVVFSIQAEGRDFLQISETSGLITTQQLLDCDWGQEHSFTISAADRGTPALTSQSQLTVRLDNCRLGQLTPGETVYFASLVENSPVDTEIVRIACDFDRVSHWNPEYSITSPSTTPFQVDPVSGVISIATPPNYEQASSHMFQVKCTDPSDAESYTTFSVYVTVTPENEHSPEFTVATYYETEISEAALPGTSVLQVEAVDEDSGTDGSVVYSIQEEMQDFVIDSNTGIVYTLGHLDRERETLHSFHVLAADRMGEGVSTKSSVVEIRVSIADRNDNSPKCDRTVYHVTLSPLLEAGEKILSLNCKDADIGPNSQLHYSLQHQSSDTLDQFAISEDTGDLVLARKFDPESGLIHEMIVTIEDRGEPQRSTVALVVVGLETSPAHNSGTSAEAEGSKNTVTFTMRDMSLNLWDAGGRESFQEAVAHSITTHCALLPDTCSLLSGCHHFYTRRRRAADEYFIAIFTEDNVVILPESIKEFSGPDGLTYLNITFYITLPVGAERSGYRTTDYVIPRTTLILLVRDEGPVIESQVRGKVAPSLTQQSSTEEDSIQNWTWGVVTLVLVMTCVCIALLTCFILEKLKSAKKRLTIAPINVPVSLTLNQKSCPKPTVASDTSGVVSPGGNSKKKRLLLRDLLRSPIVSDDDDGDAGQGRLSPQSEQDDISTIHLVGEEPNESSLQGQPRSQGSLDLSSAVSGNSARNSQKSGSGSSVGDYKQNFPYEPPRQSHGHNLHQSGPRPGAPAFAHVRKNLQPWK